MRGAGSPRPAPVPSLPGGPGKWGTGTGQVEDRFVTTRDGERIALTHHAGGRDRVILICHGFLQHRRTRLFRDLVARLAVTQDVVSMDFRGHGQSSGRYTYSARETLDLLAVLDDARPFDSSRLQRDLLRAVVSEVEPRPRYRQVSVLAFSLGAVAAMDAAVQQRGIHRLVLVSAPMAFEAIENYWWAPSSVMPALQQWDWRNWGTRLGARRLPKPRPLDLIARVSPTPVLFIHGTHDPIVAVRHSIALHAAAGEPKRIEIIPRGLHAETLFARQPEAFVRLVNTWCASR